MIEFLRSIFFKEKTEDIDLFILEHVKLKDATKQAIESGDLMISVYEKEKVNKLKGLGLIETKFVVDTEKEIETFKEIDNLKNTFEYLDKFYPHNHFILTTQVLNLCKKYNFVLSHAKNYIKNIPDNKFPYLKGFILREEDKTYYGVFPGDVYPFVFKSSGFEISTKEVYDMFSGKNPNKHLLFNKKVYYDEFPILICTQPHNLKNAEQEQKKKPYSVKHGQTAILKPIIKNGIQGFLIITTFKDSEAND